MALINPNPTDPLNSPDHADQHVQINALLNANVAANPTGSVGVAAVNGSASTYLRSDGAPAIDQSAVFAFSALGVTTWSPAARSSGVAPYLTINAPADTNSTASTEAIGVKFNGATRQHATGALATQREWVITPPTYSAVGATTITDAVTLEVTGAPVAGTNATITNRIVARFLAGTAADMPLVIKDFASQSADLFQIRRSSDNANYFSVDASFNTNVFKLIALSDVLSGGIVQWGGTTGGGGGQFTIATGYAQGYSVNRHFLLATFSNTSSSVNLYICPNTLGSNGTGDLYLNYDGSATSGHTFVYGWIREQQGPARLAADATNNTTTMANLTNLSVTLIAGRKYTGFLTVFASNSTAAEGLALDFDGGSATMTNFAAGIVGTPVGATLGVSYSTALATDLTATTATTGDVVYLVAISMVVNQGGTFIPRFSEVSHVAGTATVRLGSFLQLKDSPN